LKENLTISSNLRRMEMMDEIIHKFKNRLMTKNGLGYRYCWSDVGQATSSLLHRKIYLCFHLDLLRNQTKKEDDTVVSCCINDLLVVVLSFSF
jgi:hypothetical protein